MGRRRGGVRVRDEDHGIPAWLVDVGFQVIVAEAELRFGKDPGAYVVAFPD